MSSLAIFLSFKPTGNNPARTQPITWAPVLGSSDAPLKLTPLTEEGNTGFEVVVLTVTLFSALASPPSAVLVLVLVLVLVMVTHNT